MKTNKVEYSVANKIYRGKIKYWCTDGFFRCIDDINIGKFEK